MDDEATKVSGIAASIRGFVVSNLMFGQGEGELADNDSFMEKGILDSTGVMELANFVEETYRFKIGDDELVPDNMDSIDRLVEYISKKLAA